MKILLIFFIVLLLLCQNSYSQWQTNGGSVVNQTINIIKINGENIYIGTETGIYLSTNNGENWKKLHDLPISNQYIYCIFIDDNNIYVGTHQKGIYLSTDNGKSWKSYGLDKKIVKNIYVDNGKIYAGTLNDGLLISTNNGETWLSNNNGIKVDLSNNIDIISIAQNGTYLYAVTASNNGFYMSSDWGETWVKNNSLYENFTPRQIYVSDNNIYVGGSGSYIEGGEYSFLATIYKSTDFGVSWEEMRVDTNTQIVSLVVKDNVILAGSSVSYSGGNDIGNIYISTDSGKSWLIGKNGLTEEAVLSVAIKDDIYFIGKSDGKGIYSSSDKGITWNSPYKGILSSKVYALAEKNGIIYAGTNEGVYTSKDNNLTWQKNNNSPFGESGNLIFQGENLFASNDNGIYVSKDYGLTWQQKINGIANTYINTLCVNDNFIFAGTYGSKSSESGVDDIDGEIYVSSDNGESWTSKKKIKATSVSYIYDFDNKIFAATWGKGIYISEDFGKTWSQNNAGLLDTNFACISSKGNLLIAGSVFHGIYISEDMGKTWVEKNSGLEDAAWVKNICVIGNNIFIFTHVGRVFLSTNNGNVWKPVNEGLTKYVLTLKEIGDHIFAGCTDYSGCDVIYRAKISDLIATDVKERNTDSECMIFPNPSTDYIDIQPSEGLKPSEGSDIEILDILGEKVLSVEQTPPSVQRIDISKLSSGIYFIKIGNRLEKFVKM